jgi:peptide deformylase
MTVRDVLRYPHPFLKHVTRPIGAEDSELAKRVGADLVDTMGASPGCVGVSAPQLGELVRMVVVDVSEHRRTTRHHGLLVLVNPRIVLASGADVAREGCLSIPDLTANVRRATEVVIEASTPGGEHRAIEAEGFEARCLQHEIDHLDGILFLDRVDSLKADVFRRRRYQ